LRRGVVEEVAQEPFERVGIAAHGRVIVGGERDGRLRLAGPGVFEERARDRGESTDVLSGRASRRASPSRSLMRRPSRSLSRATAASRRSRSGRSGCSRRSVSTLACRAATGVRSFVGGVGEEARVARRWLVPRRWPLRGRRASGRTLGEAAELGVGATGVEAQLGVAVGDARCRLDDGGERAQGGAGALEDEKGGERRAGGCDHELDEKQVGDGVVDARAARADGDSRSVGENLVEDEQRSLRLDLRAGRGP